MTLVLFRKISLVANPVNLVKQPRALSEDARQGRVGCNLSHPTPCTLLAWVPMSMTLEIFVLKFRDHGLAKCH